MSTDNNNVHDDTSFMEKTHADINKDLVNYYSSLIKEYSGGELQYKNLLMNGIITFYMSNKVKFLTAPLLLKQHFTSPDKSILTLKLNPVNTDLFTFFCLANNRSKKQEAEYMLTCFFITLMNKNIDEIYFTEDEVLKFYKKGRVFNF